MSKSYLYKAAMFLILLFMVFYHDAISKEVTQEVIIDSKMTFEEAMKGNYCPEDIRSSLCIIDVQYYGFDKSIHQGQLIINKKVKTDVEKVFKLILELKFPVKKVIPICKYNWDDNKSMKDNNSSAFNYRNIANTNRLSLHAKGFAVDINPFLNPVVYNDGHINLKGARYNIKRVGTFHKNHPVVQAFKSLGWRWGGEFNAYKDNHHFDKED